MTISFPLSLPTVTGISALGMGPRSVVAAVPSPFTRQDEVQVWDGQQWVIEIQVAPVVGRANAAAWMAFLASLNGMEGTFLFGDPLAATPLGVATGTPVARSTIIYPTWNPDDKGADVVLSNGNQRAATGSSQKGAVRGSLGIDIANEKRYFEIPIISAAGTSSNLGAGIANASAPLEITSSNNANQRTYHGNGSLRSDTTTNSWGSTWTSSARIGVAVGEGGVWFALIGSDGTTTWQGGGDPEAGTGAAFTGLTGIWYPYILDNNGFGGLTADLITNPAEMLGQVPEGFEALAPFVGVNTARSRVLYTTGWTPNTTGILKAGDFLQLGSGGNSRLHMNLADADTDGSGNAALSIFPALTSDIEDGTAIIVQGAKGVFRMATNEPRWVISNSIEHGFTIPAYSVV